MAEGEQERPRRKESARKPQSAQGSRLRTMWWECYCEKNRKFKLSVIDHISDGNALKA